MSKNLCVRLVLFFALLFLVSTLAYAQGTNTLQGKVIGPNGVPPPQSVRVTLNYSGRRILEVFTDAGGHFNFTGIIRGTYELIVEGDGQTFETTRVYAEISVYSGGQQMFTQDIQLRPMSVNAAARAGVVSAFNQNVPKPARETLNRAKKMAEEGKAEMALALMREAIKIFPEYFEAHLELGNELLQVGQLNEAIAEFDRAREINDKDDRLYQSFGLVLMQQKNYAVAVAVFAEASRLNPSSPMNVLMRGIALIHQASTIDASTPDAVANRGHILDKAELALKQAAELSDNRLTADHFSLAMLYQMKGNNARAATELEQYLKKNPEARNADAIRKTIENLRNANNQKTSPASPE
ncbi:MAG: tetratricopeptide repeat protein [Pyrinomonadaceae bacterium]